MSQHASMIDVDGLGSDAREVVEAAAVAARELGARAIGTEHLLLGVLAGTSDAARTLTAAGATVAATRAKVGETSRGGRPADDAPVGLTPRATRAIGRAHRYSHGERSEEVDARHLLLGVLDIEGTAGQVLRGVGIDVGALRDTLLVQFDDSSVVAESLAGAAAGPTCPHCAATIADVAFTTVPATGNDGRSADVVVFACRGCGVALGVAARRSGSSSS